MTDHMRGILGQLVVAALCGGFLAATDGLSQQGPHYGQLLASAGGLGLGAGLLLGLPIVGLLALTRALPSWSGSVAWPALGAVLGLGLAHQLGAFARLGGVYHWTAVAVICAASCGGLVLGLLGTVIAPGSSRRFGTLQQLASRHRFVLGPALLVLAALLIVADATLWVGLYPLAHDALRLAAFWSLFCAISLLWARVQDIFRARRRLSGCCAMLAGLLVVYSFWSLHSPENAQAARLVGRPLAGGALRLLRAVTDVDGDGLSSLLGGGDCAAFDPAVNPRAQEIPQNGIDDNCLLGDAPSRDLDPEEIPVPSQPSPVSVVLITIEALRPDRMSVYGAERETTPKLRRWSQQARRFTRAYTSGGWTSVAVPTLLRGVYARRLLWTPLFETNRYRLLRGEERHRLREKERISKMFLAAVDEKRPPLTFWLRRRGMLTVAVLDDGYGEFIGEKSGAVRGFDRFVDVDQTRHRLRGDARTTALVIDQLAMIPTEQRFFLWAHYFGPHFPDSKNPSVPTFGDEVVDRYDNEVAFADAQVGRLLEHLDTREDRASTLILVTADHGEVLDTNPRKHGVDLSRATTAVPLIIRGPGIAPGVEHRPVSTVDLMPTILARTQTPGPIDLDGHDLLGLALDRAVICDTWRFNTRGKATLDLAAAYDDTAGVAFNRLQNAHTIYRWGDGPSTRDDRIARLKRRVQRYLEDSGGAIRLTD